MDLELSHATDFYIPSLPVSVSLKWMIQSNSFSSHDEFALGDIYLGFLTHTQLFCICVLGLGHFHIDDSYESLDRNHLS